MCIQWCCKNCLDKLTLLSHSDDRERSNHYFIARSEDQRITDCPRGPWVLQRAYHRNPYRGVQRCDDCIRAGRKDSKRVQSARQRTNMALGERREYTGALNVGELVVPDGFLNTPQPLVRGQLDGIKSSVEDFALANEHLPSHGLKREWATRFAASNVGVCTQSIGNASSVRQQMNGEYPEPRMALTETNYQSPYQPVQHHPMYNTYKGKPTPGEEGSQDMDPYTKSALNKPNPVTLAAGTPQGLFQENPHSNDFTPNQTIGTTVLGQASEERYRGAQHQLNLPLRASSSRSTRARPWDL